RIILRNIIATGSVTHEELFEALPVLDLLFDELVLTSTESFHRSSVRDLEKRAIHDTMSDLYNKEYFGIRLNEELRRALRSGEPLTVAMIDMDKLKEINDTYGHAAGDSAIQAIAAAIRHSCRRGDVPCRVGGDEFAVIMPETAKMQGRIFGERLMRGLVGMTVVVGGSGGMKVAQDMGNSVNPGKASLMVPVPTISVGMAAFPEDARNPETLVAKADAALYRAKNAGRNIIAL
ncbi:MAG: GGDEF domain-containing protein, partial [Chloroflexia bacterium]